MPMVLQSARLVFMNKVLSDAETSHQEVFFMQLTQKERMLLEDQKKHEEMCIKKYGEAARNASDPELQQLFSTYQQQEQQHLQTVQQILNGQVPQMQQQGSQGGQQQNSQSGQQNAQGQQMSNQNASQATGLASQQDSDMCNDMLMTEKYVSNTYDTAIFEFTNSQVRQALNHIQKEEQQHGEGIFNYMSQHGMYQT